MWEQATVVMSEYEKRGTEPADENSVEDAERRRMIKKVAKYGAILPITTVLLSKKAYALGSVPV